ncbi:hypothetical protein CsSME_00026402 [Camellia sinensis var. sinensis]
MEVNSTHFYLCLLLLLLSSIHSFVASFNEELTAQDIKRSKFPHGFFFGTSTSSYQIEGAFFEDGTSLSNWDNFTHIQDIEITHSLGVNAYRFSISWARVLPRGRFGEVNPTGVMFYNKIIDNLLFKGIEPFVTINHNDFPQELEDRYGSWLSPLMQEDFVHFAETCFKNFGDRVKYWITINEPNLFVELAYIEGIFPPSHCSEPYGNCSVSNSNMEQLIAMHNMLLSHAKATNLYRECFQPKQGGFIGIVACAFMYEPMTDDELDREAASRALAFDLAWVFDPLVCGDYPPEMRHYHGNKLPAFSPEEVNYIKGSIDFIGINHYSTYYAEDCIHSSCTLVVGDGEIIGFSYITGERNGMEEIIDYVKKRYQNKPIFVLENGYAQQQEGIPVKDLLHDVKRIEFHKAYLASLATAIRNGANVRGYFIWTLMDDFEWLDGYSVGFGLYYVHRPTLKRIPKLSAKWYRNFLTNTTTTSLTSLQDKVVMSRTSSFRKKKKKS